MCAGGCLVCMCVCVYVCMYVYAQSDGTIWVRNVHVRIWYWCVCLHVPVPLFACINTCSTFTYEQNVPGQRSICAWTCMPRLHESTQVCISPLLYVYSCMWSNFFKVRSVQELMSVNSQFSCYTPDETRLSSSASTVDGWNSSPNPNPNTRITCVLRSLVPWPCVIPWGRKMPGKIPELLVCIKTSSQWKGEASGTNTAWWQPDSHIWSAKITSTSFLVKTRGWSIIWSWDGCFDSCAVCDIFKAQ